MASMNEVILIGNMTRDPEHKQTGSGTDVCHFSLAINDRYKDKEGQMQESVTFVDCTAWGKQAAPIAQYTRKGSCVAVKGNLKLDKWETQEGEARQKLCVTARSVQFLSSGKDDMDQRTGHDEAGESQAPPTTSADDALPF
jgi:single-strand DNA-binding protein